MKIAIVELSKSHEECIYTQVHFLNEANFKVSLFLHPNLEPQIKDYTSQPNDVYFYDFNSLSFLEKIRLQLTLAKKLRSYDLVIFNTASSSKNVRNIVLFLKFYKVNCIGLLHNTNKLQGSFTQRIISTKIKNYFVLNDFLLHQNPSHGKINLESFYPIIFPKYTATIPKNKDTIWICIPGRLDYRRRNYEFLLKAASEADSKHIKYILLGSLNKKSTEGERLLKAIEQYQVRDKFILFHDFIPNDVFHTYIKESDFVMPMLNQDKNYLNYKISGSYNLAFAYRKKLLMHEFFKSIPDLKENAIFFTDTNLSDFLAKIDNSEKQVLTTYNNPKWQYNYQKDKYIAFINSTLQKSI